MENIVLTEIIIAVRRSNRLLKRIVTIQNGFTFPPLSSCIDSIGRKTSSRRMRFSSPYISEDADYIFGGITGTLPIFGGVPTLN